MATELHNPFAQLTDRIQSDDAHATHHLKLLREARRALLGQSNLDDGQRAELAERLERWRYQWIAERTGRLNDADRALIDALDLAANRLAGRPTRHPRATRGAIGQQGGMASLASPCSENKESCPHERGHATQLETAKKWLDLAVPLSELTEKATQLTAAHFGDGDESTGHRTLLYAPLYLSSFCVNECTYCGFRFDQSIERKHLSVDEAVAEAEILRRRGFRHVLLVAGDFPRLTRTEYFSEVIARLCEMGLAPAVEIAPQNVQSYAEMIEAGLCGVTLYQETYQEDLYRQYHPGGTKRLFDWRLEGPERAVEAGIKRIGLGVLLGLADPHDDMLAMIGHGLYLQERFPDCRLAFSLPRIHQAPPDFKPPHTIDDETFVRLYCALRLTFPKANLVLSTRERAELRERLAKICITQLSAGSCTAPGGYGQEPIDGQFPVHDQRGVDEVTDWLQTIGLQPVWSFEELEK